MDYYCRFLLLIRVRNAVVVDSWCTNLDEKRYYVRNP